MMKMKKRFGIRTGRNPTASRIRIIAIGLALGALIGGCKTPTEPEKVAVISIAGTWTAYVSVGNAQFHNETVLAGTLVITQRGDQFGGDFTGTQTSNGSFGLEIKNVAGPTDVGKISGQKVTFSDGLGLDYVGTIDPGTPPIRISGTASGALVYWGNNLLMTGTWTLTR